MENGKEITVTNGDEFELQLPSKTEVVFAGDSSLQVWYGKWTPDSGKLDLSSGMCTVEVDKQMVFKVRGGEGKFSATWVITNDTPSQATEFTLAMGQEQRFSDAPNLRFYLLNVTEPSAKYTLKPDNDTVTLDIFKGKIGGYVSSEATYRQKQGETASYVLTQGYWTIVGVAYSKNIEFTAKRENWVGITKLTPANGGEVEVELGKKGTYTVNYEPVNANSTIAAYYTVYGSTSPAQDVKLKSMANGVATFEVDNTASAGTGWTYDTDESKRAYNKLIFVSEEGVTANGELIVTPTAAKVSSTLTGSTNSVSIPVQNIGADEYVAYYQNGSSWTKCGSVKCQKGGLETFVLCKGLKAGGSYTFRVYSYACGKKGAYVETKGVTAYNLKPKKIKTKCTKATFHKAKKSYEWEFNWSRGWYKVYFSDYTDFTIKVSYKKPAKAKGTYVTVNGVKQKSGKSFSASTRGRTKAGQTYTITLQCVRKSGNCLAYGPSVKAKCKLKAAK